MARIPNNELDRLKQEVSLVRLVESQGYAVTRQGELDPNDWTDNLIC